MAALRRMGPILLAIVVVMASASYQTCDFLTKFNSCLEFITTSNATTPSKECCSNLTDIAKNDPNCICDLASYANDPTYSAYIPKALTLFGNCSVSDKAYKDCSSGSTSAPAPSQGSGSSPPPPSSSAILASPCMFFISALLGFAAAVSLFRFS